MRMTNDQIAALNLRLQQLGFATMGDYARALTEGVVGNKQLVEDLADVLTDRIVVKMTTNGARLRQQPPAMKSMRSPGFEPGLPAWRADVLDQNFLSERSGRRPHDLRTWLTLFNH